MRATSIYSLFSCTTVALLNSSDPSKVKFNLEQNLQTFGMQRDAFIFAVFDCCREIFDFEEGRKEAKMRHAIKTGQITMGLEQRLNNVESVEEKNQT